ncbi:MAG: hypothetical protein QM756_15365 [Polyangiaceae bacterium]
MTSVACCAAFEAALSLRANLGATGFGRPEPAQLELPRSAANVSTASFVGESSAVGVWLEARYRGVLGVAAGALYGYHSVRSSFRVDDEVAQVIFGAPELRVPLMLKGTLPLGSSWTPYLELGPEFVLPGLSKASQRGGLRAVASAEAGLWFSSALGVEWKLGLAGVDLRVPLGVRASFSGAGEQHVRALPSDALSLESTPSYRVAFETGAALWF